MAWPKLTKNANFGPNLVVFGQKILFFYWRNQKFHSLPPKNWITKCLISPVKIWIFCPKTTKIWPEIGIHFWPGLAGSFGGLVGGCGTRAVSRKTPIYFMMI